MLFLGPTWAARQFERYPGMVGVLATPHDRRRDTLGILPWGADNGCFNGEYEASKFYSFISTRTEYAPTCKFIIAPDVVGDAAKTFESFGEWEPRIHQLGLPVALALQDGMTLPAIPWDSIEAVFVGGSTEYKLGQDVVRILERATELGKWRHIGRLSSTPRLRHFWGLADSFDGSAYNRFAEDRIPGVMVAIAERKAQLPLFGMAGGE